MEEIVGGSGRGGSDDSRGATIDAGRDVPVSGDGGMSVPVSGDGGMSVAGVGAGGMKADALSMPESDGGGAMGMVGPVDVAILDLASKDVLSPIPDAAREAVPAPGLGPPPLPACIATKNRSPIGIWVSGDGNCSYPVPPAGDLVGGVDLNLYAKGARCGACMEVSTATGSVVVRVVDSTPVPASGNDITISEAAFRKIAPVNDGIVQADWRWVPCPTTTPIMGALKGDSDQYYWAAIFDNVVNPIAKLEYVNRGNDTTWKEVKREQDNYFYNPMASGLPGRYRMTDTSGAVVETGVLQWNAPIHAFQSLGVQFPVSCRR